MARNHDKPQTTAIDLILKEQNCTEQFNTQVSPEFQDLLKQCLTIDNSKRPTVKHLLKLPMFNEVQSSKNGFCDNSTVLNGGTMYMFSPTLRCANLDLPTSEECTDDYLSERSLEEVKMYCNKCSCKTINIQTNKLIYVLYGLSRRFIQYYKNYIHITLSFLKYLTIHYY